MTSRDKRMDDLEAELRADPYIHEPDTKDLKQGMECWLDQTRMCGAACMAYNVDDIDEDGNVIDGPDRCLVLQSTSAQGAAAVLAVTASIASLSRAQRAVMDDQIAAQDAVRKGQEPPVPRGHKEKE